MKNKTEINKTIFYLDSWDGDMHCPKCGHCLISQGKDGEDDLLTCLHCKIAVRKAVVQSTFLDILNVIIRRWYIRIPTAMAFFYLAIVAMIAGFDLNNSLEMILFTILGFDVLLLWR